MNYNVQCTAEHPCGRIQLAHSHSINKNMVSAFIKFCEAYIEEKAGININTDLNFTHNQLANFRKFKFFGLVMKIGGGLWVPTMDGLAWYYGEIAVPERVITLNEEVLPLHHQAWEGVSLPDRKYIFEIDNLHYKKRPEYQEPHALQSKLFL